MPKTNRYRYCTGCYSLTLFFWLALVVIAPTIAGQDSTVPTKFLGIAPMMMYCGGDWWRKKQGGNSCFCLLLPFFGGELWLLALKSAKVNFLLERKPTVIMVHVPQTLLLPGIIARYYCRASCMIDDANKAMFERSTRYWIPADSMF